MALQDVILYRAQSLLSPQIDVNFRNLSSCDTTVYDQNAGGGGNRVGDTLCISSPLQTTFAFTNPLFQDVFIKIP